jgi:hypothetical protein
VEIKITFLKGKIFWGEDNKREKGALIEVEALRQAQGDAVGKIFLAEHNKRKRTALVIFERG